MSMARIPTSLRSISSTQPSRASSIRFLSGRRPAPVRSTHSLTRSASRRGLCCGRELRLRRGTLAGWRTVWRRRTDGSTMRIYMFVEFFSRVSVVSSAWARRSARRLSHLPDRSMAARFRHGTWEAQRHWHDKRLEEPILFTQFF